MKSDDRYVSRMAVTRAWLSLDGTPAEFFLTRRRDGRYCDLRQNKPSRGESEPVGVFTKTVPLDDFDDAVQQAGFDLYARLS